MEITTANDLRKFSVQELRDMFQDFERLLIEILTGRMETKDV